MRSRRSLRKAQTDVLGSNKAEICLIMGLTAEGIYFFRRLGEEAAIASPFTECTGQIAGCTHQGVCIAIAGKVSEGREVPASWEPEGLLTPRGYAGKQSHPAQVGAEHLGEL